MNIVFVSNYYNHHQRMLSKFLDENTKQKYTFIATSEMKNERKKLGYGEEIIPSFVLDARIKPVEIIEKKISEANVIICGTFNRKIVKALSFEGKLIFKYSERIMKKRTNALSFICKWVSLRLANKYHRKNYLLCAGAFVANDYNKFGLFRNRMYKWGYFPETKVYEKIEDVIGKKKKNQLLWCGRFIDWKHPDDAVEVAKLLKDEGYVFELKIIGSGELEQELLKKIKEYDLCGHVNVLKAMKPAEIRTHMEEAGIYLFTSDRQEGWGAVLNEAMNSGCAVVASNEIGSVPYLIKDGINGIVYESRNIKELYEQVKNLLETYERQDELGKLAYQTIVNEWNAKVAAERLINLSKHILDGEISPELYKSGPCSKESVMVE